MAYIACYTINGGAVETDPKPEENLMEEVQPNWVNSRAPVRADDLATTPSHQEWLARQDAEIFERELLRIALQKYQGTVTK